MSIIVFLLVICFFIGIFNVVTRLLFGIGWCIWQCTKVLGIIIIILLILSAIGNWIK